LQIHITFIPLTLCQAQIEFQFSTSEYGFKPILCLAYGVGELELPKAPPLPEKLKPIKPAVIHQKSKLKSNLLHGEEAMASSAEPETLQDQKVTVFH
jgi:hypothetical protein